MKKSFNSECVMVNCFNSNLVSSKYFLFLSTRTNLNVIIKCL